MTLSTRVERYMPLDDIQVRSEGGERIIDAYAAVFNARQEIRDQEGHYLEVIDPGAFSRTIEQRSGRFQVMFNHGKTMHGTPSERFSMPYGVPVEVRADQTGLFTSTKVAKTPLGDEVLELVESGAVRGQSFSGSFLATSRQQARTRGDLPVYTRTEISMREYGVTPFPAYEDARVVGVRSEAAELLDSLSTDELAEFLRSLTEPARADLVAVLSDLADTSTVEPQEAPGPPDASEPAKSRFAMDVDLLTLEGVLNGPQ